MTPKTQATKAKINKWDYLHQIFKTSGCQKKPPTERNGNTWNGSKYLQIMHLMGVISRICKELLQINNKKKTNNPIQNWRKDLKKTFLQEDKWPTGISKDAQHY